MCIQVGQMLKGLRRGTVESIEKEIDTSDAEFEQFGSLAYIHRVHRQSVVGI